jgi:hypothetical protein
LVGFFGYALMIAEIERDTSGSAKQVMIVLGNKS